MCSMIWVRRAILWAFLQHNACSQEDNGNVAGWVSIDADGRIHGNQKEEKKEDSDEEASSAPRLMRKRRHDRAALDTEVFQKDRGNAAGAVKTFIDSDGHIHSERETSSIDEAEENEDSEDRENQEPDEATDGQNDDEKDKAREPPVRGQSMTAEDWYALKSLALPLHAAEERFHRVFPPVSSQQESTEDGIVNDCDDKPTPLPHQATATCGSRWQWLVSDQGYTTDAAMCAVKSEEPEKCACLSCAQVARAEANPNRISDLVTSFEEAIQHGKAGTTGCLHMHIDLTFAHVPNCLVSLGVEGALVRDSGTNCVSWKFRTNIGFNVKIGALGIQFFARIALRSTVELEELYCKTYDVDSRVNTNEESYYCRYLDIIVPNFTEHMRGKCHTDSPFDLILTYIKYQWQQIHTWVRRNIFRDRRSDYFGSPLEKNLKKIRAGLLKYPALFRRQTIEHKHNTIQDALQPRRLRVGGWRRWVWCIRHESRLCWSKHKPKSPQEKSRTDKKLLQLHRACTDSIGFGDVTSLFDTITRHGKTVVVPLRFKPRHPLKIEFDSDQDAKKWKEGFVELLTASWKHKRKLLKSKCMKADLHVKADPYCVLDMPGKQWASSWHHKTNHPDWSRDGVGFPVDQESNGSYQAELIVSVRDMDTWFGEKAWEWLTQGLKNDPLKDYLGEAQVRICSDPKSPQWKKIGELNTCKSIICELKTGNDNDCKVRCLQTPGCKGIEWLSDGKCFLFYSTCGVSLLEINGTVAISDGSVLERGEEEGSEQEASASAEKNDESRILLSTRVAAGKKENEARSVWWGKKTQNQKAARSVWWGKKTQNQKAQGARGTAWELEDPGCDVHPGIESLSVPLHRVEYKSKGMLWWRKRWHELKHAGEVKLQFQWADDIDSAQTWVPGMTPSMALWQTESGKSVDVSEEGSTTHKTYGASRSGYSYPGLVSVAQAMFAAMDQYLGKIPDYVNQVKQRLKPYAISNKFEDGGLDYQAWDGRFGARWNPRVEEEEEYYAEDEKLECPAPLDSGTHHKMKCDLDRMHGKKGAWWNKLKEAVINMFTNPPCERHKPEVDDRVLNFERGMHESKYAQTRATEMGFYAELTGSMMNLFIRMIGDVQALFNVYFADEPDWDGNCFRLPSEYMLPYEFGVEPGGGHMRWTATPKEFSATAIPIHRADGIVSQKGWKMSNSKNPFCKWPWASSRKRQKHRVDFVKQDAPTNGRDGYVAVPREASAHMRPHIWCRVARAYRESMGEDAPFGSNRATGENGTNGTTIRYRSACLQVRVAGYGKKGWTAEPKFRWECEDVFLTPSFVILFPGFISHLIGEAEPLGVHLSPFGTGWFGELGTIAEDILQCTGRITAHWRQFETDQQSSNIDTLCDSSQEHLDTVLLHRGNRYEKIMRLVKTWADALLQKLRDFADWLGKSDAIDLLAEEFHDAFSYTDVNDMRGTMFTGRAWKAGLTVAEEEMGTVDAIEPRIKESLDLAVQEAFTDRGGDASGLFTLPVKSSVTYQVELGLAFSLSNLCSSSVSGLLLMNLRTYTTGYSWIEWHKQNGTNICFAGVVAPIKLFYLLIDIDFCGQALVDGGMQWTRHVRVKSVIFPNDKIPNVWNKTIGQLFKAIIGVPPLNSDIEAKHINEIIENAAWQVARRILSDTEVDENILKVVAKSALSGPGYIAKRYCRKIADHIRKKLFPIAKEVKQMKFVNAAKMAVKYVLEELIQKLALMNKDIAIVTVGVIMKKLKPKNLPAQSWTKEVDVQFSKVRATRIGISHIPFINMPGMDSGFTFKYEKSFTRDLSAGFRKIMAGWGVLDTNFDCCTACLDTVGNGYCQKHKGRPMCFALSYFGNPAEDVPCDETGDPATAGPFFRYMDCANMGMYGKEKLQAGDKGNCKVAGTDTLLASSPTVAISVANSGKLTRNILEADTHISVSA